MSHEAPVTPEVMNREAHLTLLDQWKEAIGQTFGFRKENPFESVCANGLVGSLNKEQGQ